MVGITRLMQDRQHDDGSVLQQVVHRIREAPRARAPDLLTNLLIQPWILKYALELILDAASNRCPKPSTCC